MKKRIITICFLILIVLLHTKSYAIEKIKIELSDTSIEKNKEFDILIDTKNSDIAAFTIWAYYEAGKVECVSNTENLNIMNDKVIYTWYSQTGENENFEEPIKLKFKAKEEGTTSIDIIGEFYNEKGERIDIKYEDMMIDIEAEKTRNSNDDNSSNNVNLDVMRVNQEGITPQFQPDIYEYYLVLEENIKQLDITAIPPNSNSKVEIKGNNLKKGLNKVEILVTSKDGSKTNKYVINVTITDNEKEANASLETLAIEGYNIIPEYSDNITNYSVEVGKNTSKLNVLAIAEDMDANVKITGNDKIKEGHNKVSVEVTARDGITKRIYDINVYKRNDEEEVQHEIEENKIEELANEASNRIESNMIEDENSKEDENTDLEDLNEQEKKQWIDEIFAIIGTILAVVVLGIVIYKVRDKNKK